MPHTLARVVAPTSVPCEVQQEVAFRHFLLVPGTIVIVADPVILIRSDLTATSINPLPLNGTGDNGLTRYWRRRRGEEKAPKIKNRSQY